MDILNAARRIVQYTTGVTEEEFERNDLLQDATMRQLEIIGEAARKVSQENRSAHPEIPWSDMIGMRNRLIHEYSRINLKRVWDTSQLGFAEPVLSLSKGSAQPTFLLSTRHSLLI